MANRQLEEIHEEISQRFSRHSAVAITALEGNPPDKYQVQYSVAGLHKADSDPDPIECEEHRVTITIPFGFPHFPPSCIPESPIFHPDFDPAAICIGEFWTPDKKLTELIIHIGQLITAEQFSTENAFNEEALIWYQQHPERLPLTTFPVDAVIEQQEELVVEDFDDVDDDLELEVIDDIDLSDDFSTLSLEDATEEQQTPPPLTPDTAEEAVDHDLIQLLQKKKRYQALNEYLHNIAAEAPYNQQDELLSLTEQELEKAQKLYREAEVYEHEGNPVHSLQKYQEVQNCVSDYPGIEEDIKRTEQSVELLGSFEETPSETAVEDKTEEPVEPRKEKTPETTKKKVKFFDQKDKEKSTRYIPYAFGGILLVCLLGASFVYYTNTSRYSKANDQFIQCQSAFSKHDFTATEKLCNDALAMANDIHYVKTGEADKLVGAIKLVLSSEDLKQGLAGNIKYNGRYISLNSFKAIEKFNQYVNDGEKAYGEQDWRQAADQLSQALALAAENQAIDQEMVPELQEKTARAKFTAAYDAGLAFTRQKSWKEASLELTAAAEELSGLDMETQQKYGIEIEKLQQEALYQSLNSQADAKFDSGQWAEAATIYKEILVKSPIYVDNHPALVRELQEKITKAQLYSTIQAGKDAFGNADWDSAIEKYNSAIQLLNENRQILNKVSSEENSKKLSRIKLQASIIRDQQGAALDLKKNHYQDALIKFKRILDAIDDSPFSVEDEFVLVREDTQNALKSTRDEMFIRSRTEYLNQNYQKIFLENFPAALSGNLSEPRIEFIEKIDDRFLFKLECLETGGGRPLRLVLNYLYDPATKTWSSYTP